MSTHMTKCWMENGKLVVQVIPEEQIYKREWVDLTDDEMLMIYGQQHEGKKYSLGRMVQANLKAKNFV